MPYAQILVSDIRAGDIILPPARELRLWMRRHMAEHNLPESWLHIVVSETYVDGGWLFMRGVQNIDGEKPQRWTIKARPSTKWTLVGQRATAVATQPTLATFEMQRDGIDGVELPGTESCQYALAVMPAIDGQRYGEIFRRAVSQHGTYGGWRWECSPSHVLRYAAQYPAPMVARVREVMGDHVAVA